MDYSLKNVDDDLWVLIKVYAAKKKISIKQLILDAVKEKITEDVSDECED